MMFPYVLLELTHVLSQDAPCWNNDQGFKSHVALDYADCGPGVAFKVQHLAMHAGVGTHIDAPAHTCKNGATVEQIPLQDLIVPCVVIDTSAHCTQDYRITMADIKMFESEYGPIKAGVCVFFYTGWSRYWHDRVKYHNDHHFPSIDPAVADYLLQRDIVGIGIDTLSPDVPHHGFLVHEKLLGAGKYIIENVAHLKKLPKTGAFSCVLPLLYKGGTESPVRLIGFVKHI